MARVYCIPPSATQPPVAAAYGTTTESDAAASHATATRTATESGVCHGGAATLSQSDAGTGKKNPLR